MRRIRHTMPSPSVSRRISPWPSREERDRDRELKREAVLRTAVGLFNEKGFHATSLDDVAEALKVTKPTIYHYFSNKDEVLFECVRRGVESIRDGSIAPGDPRLVTFTLTGALNWIARWYDAKGSMSREEIADGCVATLVNGLAPRGRRN